jgi:UvrD/REP helicase N-terminal domain/UvrD-like helicase C-terminal domain
MTSEDVTDFFAPTDEQFAALDLFREGETMVIDALAGTGKTSTLMLLASDTKARGQYLAFNKAIVADVERKLPDTCAARTAHSLAYGVVGKHFRHRLNGPRIRSEEIAAILDIRDICVTYAGEEKRLEASFLAGQVMDALSNFCKTDHERPTEKHFSYIKGVDLPDDQGNRTWTNNDRLRGYLFPRLEKAWADVQNIDGHLRYNHEHYLKVWQLRDPKIPADYVMFDEAQDASPVMAAIVAAQTHAQCVYVGDARQAIYGWNGAIDAMEGFESEHRSTLSQSFRFGPLIAIEANLVLAQLGSDLMVTGLPSIESIVGEIDGYPDAVLCRTNAATLTTVIRALDEGHPFHLVGDGKELVAFAKGAQVLKDGRRSKHPELACFVSWQEVVDYVAQDPAGAELKLLVTLIDKFGPKVILDALEEQVPEGPGVLTISTTHKAKGREWDRVRLDMSMGEFGSDIDELRLRYVAITRARTHLDLSDFEEGLARAEERARR